ncbi:oligoribonuclease [Buchnera aphidicola]|uniref:oligoribonuclease n=1 Tax=Buchnera aphidicola TaxID=9 RepID=UPI0030EE20B7
MNKKNNLIWLDLEMTGLNIKKNHILSIGIIITNNKLKILSPSLEIVIKQSKKKLKRMNLWNKTIHKKNGLIKKSLQSLYTENSAEKKILKFLKKWSIKNNSPLCGNSIHQDRKFLLKYMPKLEKYFHYRSIDVSTIKELYYRWKKKKIKKKNRHQTISDIKESIKELLFYKKNFFKIK